MGPTVGQGGYELVISRVFDATREKVWAAWTVPEEVTQWWGPWGFSTSARELDLRAGGRWRYVMRGSDGTEYPVQGVFREVVPIDRIVTSDEIGTGQENVDDPERPGPVMITCAFDDLGSQTRLTLRISHETAEDRRKHEAMGVVDGWNSSLDCLAEYLARGR